MGGPALKVGGLGMIVLVVIGLLMGVNPLSLLSMVGGGGAVSQAPRPTPKPGTATQPGAKDEQAEFVSVVLGETEDTWGQIFAAAGKRYPPPTLVMFSDGVQSACGLTSAAAGPFYCPGDQKVYVDLSFFRELDKRFDPAEVAPSALPDVQLEARSRDCGPQKPRRQRRPCRNRCGGLRRARLGLRRNFRGGSGRLRLASGG
jgi:predicted metalloprotease